MCYRMKPTTLHHDRCGDDFPTELPAWVHREAALVTPASSWQSTRSYPRLECAQDPAPDAWNLQLNPSPKSSSDCISHRAPNGLLRFESERRIECASMSNAKSVDTLISFYCDCSMELFIWPTARRERQHYTPGFACAVVAWLSRTMSSGDFGLLTADT